MGKGKDMIQEWKPDIWTKLYVFSLCLLVYAGANVSWLSVVSLRLLYFVVLAFAIIKMMQKGVSVSSKKIIWLLVWFIYGLMVVVTHNVGFNGFIHQIFVFLVISSVILLSIDEMKYLLKALTVCFVVILVVSIPAWILYLLGVPLPHTGPHYHENGFHVYYNYFFFTTSAKVTSSDYSRFSSVFLEPGQMATPCMFLFHINTKEGRFFRFENIVMLVAVVMSFSLIAYGLLIVSLVANQIRGVRHNNGIAILTIIILAGLTIYFVNHEENAVNELILSRLEFNEEEGTISGYNRTTEDFDIRFDNMMNTSNKYFGIHDEENLDWITNTSGYKKFIVLHGIVGLTLLMLLMLILLWDNFNGASLVFIIMVVVAFFVRNLLTSTLWLSITIIGMYILGRSQNTKNTRCSDISDLNRQQALPIEEK